MIRFLLYINGIGRIGDYGTFWIHTDLKFLEGLYGVDFIEKPEEIILTSNSNEEE